jgi:signal transduction histidine kinase
LHDDIGANLSRVAILSELAKRELTDNPTQSTSLLDSIAVSARETADSMRDIVWAIDPRHNDLDEVVSRVRVFASSVLEARGIQWQLDVPKDLARVKLDPEQQRQIYLFFKEAVHNIVRHSQCRTATAVVEVGDRLVVCRISDDGRGLRPELSDPTSGRLGLAGLRARANALGGDLTVASVNGGGTTLTLTVPRKLKR